MLSGPTRICWLPSACQTYNLLLIVSHQRSPSFWLFGSVLWTCVIDRLRHCTPSNTLGRILSAFLSNQICPTNGLLGGVSAPAKFSNNFTKFSFCCSPYPATFLPTNLKSVEVSTTPSASVTNTVPSVLSI